MFSLETHPLVQEGILVTRWNRSMSHEDCQEVSKGAFVRFQTSHQTLGAMMRKWIYNISKGEKKIFKD